MSKTYSNKSNAIRGFKSLHPELAAGLDNKQIAEKFLRMQHDEGPGTPAGWNVVIPADVKVVKRHIYKGVQFRRNSVEPEGITSMVHSMFDEYQAEAEDKGVELTRKQFIARAVRDGVAYYTARTQYQKWLRR